MKTISKTLYIILALAATLGACKKDDTTTPTTTGGGSATVTAGNYGFDGSASLGKFNSTKAGITQTTVAGITTFTVSAIKDGSNEAITIIVLQKVSATGKITFGPSLSNGGITITKDYTKPADRAVNYNTDQNATNGTKGGGEINITKISGNSVEGTFYAVAHNSTGAEAFVEQGTFTGTITQ
jgi:hypothetical protein